MKVCKFGGSSVANAAQIKKVSEIIMNDPGRRFVVVSAPGKSRPSEMKITDLLIALANAKEEGFDCKREKAIIIKKYQLICEDLQLPEETISFIKKDLEEKLNGSYENSKAFMAALKSTGERASAKILSDYLQIQGMDSEFVEPYEAGLILNGEYDDAVVMPDSYEHLKKLRKNSHITVIPGFYSKNAEGKIVTFSRGGSDITGAVLAAALDAPVYENWTDVSAIYAVDPALLPETPVAIKELSYREMRELVYLGTGIVHPEALAPTYAKAIPIHILNTNDPDAPGTYIVRERASYNGVVTGIAGWRNFVSLNISEYLLNRRFGIVTAILAILTEEGVAVEHIPSSIDSLSLIIREEELGPETAERCVDRLKNELGLEKVEVQRGLAVVMIVGEAMKDTVGVAARAVSALSAANVSLEMIIQDHSEMSVIFVVDGRFCNYAVETLYNEYFVR